MTHSIRIASLNVKRLAARERDRAARIGAFVGALAPDVVALQEIEEEPAAEVCSHARLPHHTFVGHAPGKRRGVALLHRTPALLTSGERLAARPGDDKGYTRARVMALGREIEIVGVHLDWISRSARARQIDALAGALGRPEVPRVVFGDLNAMTLGAWLRGDVADDTVMALSLALGVLPSPRPASRTFPSRTPRWALDWILVSPELTIERLEVAQTALSDHAAIVADVALEEAA